MASYESLLEYIPGVKRPEKKPDFREKAKWTLSVLAVYYVLSYIVVWGIDRTAVFRLEEIEAILGASFGSIITLGIGPIVTASILLQLVVGAGLLPWDLSRPEDRIKFQGTQKLLAIVICFVEAVAYTLLGGLRPMSYTTLIVLAVILQIALGGIIIIYLDEVVSKWGFGSGVSLFIAAGVSKTLGIRLLNPLALMASEGAEVVYTLPTATLPPQGIIPRFIYQLVKGTPDPYILLPIIPTLFIFLIVVYAQAMRVEIPLAFGHVRGFVRKWPLRFIYANVIPVIFVSALLININVWGKLLADRGFPVLGTFDERGNPISGLAYYLSVPHFTPLEFASIVFFVVLALGTYLAFSRYPQKKKEIILATIPGAFLVSYLATRFVVGSLPLPIDVLRATIYTTVMVVGSVIFSIFWVYTAGMDPKSVARQIQSSGMQIPGFRRDVRIIERVLERYIPGITVLGGAFVGFLAAISNYMGALTRGTGLLLAVMIIYQFYEEIAKQHLEDMHPALRRFVEL